MTQEQALNLVARLVAAYSHPVVSEETVALYVERVAKLEFLACRRAIDDLIDADLEHLPRIGRIKRVTGEHVVKMREEQARRRRLEAPAPSEEEREAMRQRIRDLVNEVTKLGKTTA